jgi:hypothetical protein
MDSLSSFENIHLTERALLTVLTINEWRGRRHDKEVSAHVARENGADRSAGCYTKALLPKQYLGKIAQVRTEARTLHHELTLPWCDDGFRILPVDLHLTYMERFRDLRTRFQAAVSEFLTFYGDAKEAARESLGTLYREADYPSPNHLRRAFDFEIKLQPLPSVRDWRIDLPQSTIDRIRQELEARHEEAQRLAMADLYRRLAGTVSRMATTLSQPEKIFRDSLVGNLRELCSVLPQLNIARDPRLAELAEKVELRLARLEPSVLRHDPAVRQRAGHDAAALLDTITSRLASYTGPVEDQPVSEPQ